MKRLVLSAAAAVALAAVMPALAQQPPQVPIPKGVFVKGQTPGQYLARDRLVGLPCTTPAARSSAISKT